MSELIPLLRALIRDELRALQLGEIGVVTQVYPHGDDSDAANYECSVRVKNSTLELRQVPICTPHIGMVSTPRVGDLVVVTYLQGDPNAPIIIGRLYSDESRPPVHAEKAWHVESPLQDTTSLTLAADGAVKVKAGDTTLTLLKSGDVEINSAAALKVQVKGEIQIQGSSSAEIKVEGDATISASNVTVKAGAINLGEGGGGVITTMSHKCYFTGAPLIGSTSVKAKM